MNFEERQLLNVCKDKIEEILKWGTSVNWSNQEFDDLSEKLFEATGVKLSITTLKRIWGKVKYEGAFNKVTLNALAQFIGYENWTSFEGDHSGSKKAIIIEDTPGSAYVSPKKPKNAFRFKVAACLIILLCAFLIVSNKNIPSLYKRKSTSPIKFTSKKTSDNLPNSVVFNYDVTSLDADSFFIQQNWDPKRRERVSSEKAIHTSIYYYPGNFNARLIADDQVVKKTRVFIKTKGWKGIIEKAPLPIYLSEKEIVGDGLIGISRETLKEKTGSAVFNNAFTHFYNIRSFEGLRANNFVFEASLRNTSSVEECLCRRVYINILFDGGVITIPLSDKGCISSLHLSTGDKVLEGKESDLSKFGCDFKDFQTVQCKVQKQRMSVLLNGKQIFNENLVENLSEIVGLKISFEGTGEIKKVMLGYPGKPPVLDSHFKLRSTKFP
jgi:hypothetical protein